MTTPAERHNRPLPDGTPLLPNDNIYGHMQRLDWFAQHISRTDRVIEFGCGTGYMITYPMRVRGYDVTGVDTDAESIRYGQSVLEQAGLDPRALRCVDLADVEDGLDAIIASEVFEHLDDYLLADSLDLIHQKLHPGGRLLITVPNGWGWFEFEALVWNRFGIANLLARRAGSGAARGAFANLKRWATNDYVADALPSTLANSPHVQRFTLNSIQRVVRRHGFDILDRRGSVLICGPLSDITLTGLKRLMEFNRRLGWRWPRIAAGFYVAAVRR